MSRSRRICLGLMGLLVLGFGVLYPKHCGNGENFDYLHAQGRNEPVSRGIDRRTVEVTAYVAEPGALTASGTVPLRGRTVAAAPEIPFGSVVFILDPYFESWGNSWFVVEDRGSAVQGPVIDVYFGLESAETVQEALNWGRRVCQVLIIPMTPNK